MNYNPYSLEGKTILITGASSGIGRATAIECAKMGAELVITGRNTERLQDTYNQLEGTAHVQVTADITTAEGIETLCKNIPALDGVFFCAGVTDTTLVKFLDKEKIDRVMDINLIAPMLLTKHLLKKRLINKYASLVYMSSMGAETVTAGLGIYAASKNALISFARAVAHEMSNRMIRSNVIMASMVRTELVDNIQVLTQEDLAKDEARYPLGYGRPEDVAYACIYLLSDASKWMTGSCIKLDGGSTLG